MDIGKALSYITEDPRWKEKVAIGTGVVILSSILSAVLIGVVGFLIVMGYMIRLLQNVRDGVVHPMPEWDQWSDDLVRGLKFAVVIIIWALPAILFSIPVSLGGALIDSRGAAGFIGTTILFGGMCLVILYSLFLAVAQASFSIAFARDEKISSGLQVREIWEWTLANIGQLVIVALAYIVASIGISLVASIVGTLLCIIGLIVTLPLAQLVIYLFQYNLYGQLAASYPFAGASGTAEWTPPPPPVAPTDMTASGFEQSPYAAYGPADEPTVADSAAATAPSDFSDTGVSDTDVSDTDAALAAGTATGTTTDSDVTAGVDAIYPDSGIEESSMEDDKPADDKAEDDTKPSSNA
jgi:hypothetical protein